MKALKILIALVPLLGGAGVGFSQPLKCSNTMGGANPDFGFSVAEFSIEKFLVAGYTNMPNGFWNAQLNVLDTNCTILSNWILPTNKNEKVFDMVYSQLANEIVLTGNSFNATIGSNDALFLKVDTLGNVLNRTYIGGPENNFFYSIIANNDSTYTAAGLTGISGNEDYYIVKLDKNGTVLWQKNYGGTAKDIAMSIAKTTTNGYVVAGFTLSFGLGGRDIWLLNLDANGDTLWAKTFGGTQDDTGYEVITTQDGGFAVAGYTTSFGNGGDGIIVKTDANGNLLWQKNYGNFGQEQGFSIKENNDGNLIMTGNKTITGNKDVWLVKTSAIGDTLWTRTYGGSSADNAEQVIITSQENYAIVGNTQSFGNGLDDFYFLHIIDTSIVTSTPQQLLPQNGSTIYPNPFTGNFYIDITSGSQQPYTVTVVDIFGKKVFEKITNEKIIQVNLLDKPDGIYLVKIQSSTQTIINKIIKN